MDNSEYQRLWARRNREKTRAYNRKWFQSHKAQKAKWQRNYRKVKGAEVRAWGKANRIRARYGLTVPEYDRYMKHPCGICFEWHSRMHLDHDHRTRAIRGVLCENCNRGLGMFKDDVVRLYAAVGYLIQYAKEA